ncbi:hypothetical protein ACS0TY_029703 [Phlomoides rotata]
MKKSAPDWLNSSLWSSPHPPPSPPRNDSAIAVAVSPPAAESPPEPPAYSPNTHTTNEENRDPLSNTDGYNASACCRDEENGGTSANSAASVAQPPANLDISRQTQILEELSKKVINMVELRKLASQGIPDTAGIRATVWKSEITRRLEESGHENHELDVGNQGFLSRSEINHGEHPLSLGKSSIWNQFFKESEIVEQIDRDVMRTHPDIHFFSGDSSSAKSNQEALRNILIIFAKLNPGLRYVQGMNEILAPLYYIFKNDPNEENADNVEADTFFCFMELLSGFRDNFVQQLDNSVVGIRATITRLSQLLKEHDEELWRHLEMTSKVNPQFYAFRWITLLLTQEFNFADILFIWDTLLSDPDGPQVTLLRVCCAMLVIVRKRLLAGDFTSNLKLLQNYPPTNISHLLYVANKLRAG